MMKNQISTMKNYIEEARTKMILKAITDYICLNNKTENEFAEAVQDYTDEQVTIEEFHDWITSFDVDKIKMEY